MHLPLFQQAYRFLIAGGLNTLLTLAVYQILLFWVNYTVAYTIAFALGIVFTGFVYVRFVFGGKTTRKKFLANAIYYITSYLASLVLLDIIVRVTAINERLAIFVTMACIIPVNFFVLRRLLSGTATS